MSGITDKEIFFLLAFYNKKTKVSSDASLGMTYLGI